MKIILLLISFCIAGTNISQEAFAQSEKHNDHILFVQGNYLRNLGTFGQVWSRAAGGYIGYGIYFPAHNLLMFRTGFMSHTIRSGEHINGNLNVIPLQVGGRYYFTESDFRPFFQFMNGFNIAFENVSLKGEKKDRTLFKYFWQVGTGATFDLSDKFKLDLSLNYNSAFYDNNKELYHEAGAMMNGFEYSIGIGWLLK